MAIFDNIVQSTKNIAAITKYNSMISDEQKKIDGLYYQIGRAYYEANRNNPNDYYASYIAAISEALSNIAQYNELIKEAKGLAKCPNCGADVPVESAFCNSCGTRMPARQSAQQTGNMVRCSNCGNYVPAGNKFCTNCGGVLSSAPPEQTAYNPSANNQQYNNPPTSTTGTKSCPYCGKPIKPDTVYCTGCGQRVG